MKKQSKNRKRRPVKSIDAGGNNKIAEPVWTPAKRRVTQEDVNQAAKRTEVEQQATLVSRLRQSVRDLQGEQRHLESRLQQTRTDIATTMLQHVEAIQKFKDMTALQHEVP